MLFQLAANKEELSLIEIALPLRGLFENQVQNLRLSSSRDLPKFVRVYGHLSPSHQSYSASCNDRLCSRFHFDLGFLVIPWKEEYPYGEIGLVTYLVPHCRRSFPENRVGNLGQNSGSVSGFHVCVHRSTVGHVTHGSDRVIQSLIISVSVQQGDGAHSAIIALVTPPVERSGGVWSEIWMVKAHIFRLGQLAQNLGRAFLSRASAWVCRAFAILLH